MNKYLRIAVLVLTVVLCCICFVGCNALNDMRLHHGTWTEDGNILLNGVEYIRLPENNYFSPTVDDYYSTIHITEDGVPVLLSGIKSDGYGYSAANGTVIYWVDYNEDNGYYCREDRYDEMVARINSEFIAEGYCYDYYDYENETDEVYYLTKDEVEAVAAVRNSVEPTEIPSSTEIYYDYTIYLYECSADLTFKKEVFELCTNDGEYCIVDNYGSAPLVYQVPDEYKSEFDSIFDAYINSENYWYDEEYYEEDFYA